ncbi:MAG: chorismate-binding protein [Ilumatobacteraceae bacterium]
MEGRLSDPRPNVLDLVRALSPTPALGGFPRDEALAVIAAAEGFDRGRYGGAVGWVDAAGDGTWAVTIRCAALDRPHQRGSWAVAASSRRANPMPSWPRPRPSCRRCSARRPPLERPAPVQPGAAHR